MHHHLNFIGNCPIWPQILLKSRAAPGMTGSDGEEKVTLSKAYTLANCTKNMIDQENICWGRLPEQATIFAIFFVDDTYRVSPEHQITSHKCTKCDLNEFAHRGLKTQTRVKNDIRITIRTQWAVLDGQPCCTEIPIKCHHCTEKLMMSFTCPAPRGLFCNASGSVKQAGPGCRTNSEKYHVENFDYSPSLCSIYLLPHPQLVFLLLLFFPSSTTMPRLSSRKVYPLVDHIKQKSREERISMAIDAIRRSGFRKDGHFQMSYRKAEKLYGIPHTTISNRLKEITQPAQLAHEFQQKLTNAQEQVLAEWAKHMSRRGIPLTRTTLREYARVISGKDIGQNWVDAFMRRQDDELKIKWTQSLEKCRAASLNPTAVKEFYDLLEELV